MMALVPFGYRMLAAAAIMVFAAAPSFYPADTRLLSQGSGLARQMEASLSEMSTGEAQGLVLEGTDAQSRNALIPVVSGLRPQLSAYSPFDDSPTDYATAKRCLTQAIYYEAANEPELGKRAVAQVVINRMRHPAYPNTVCGVVYQGVNARVCQFSFTCDGALLRRPMARQWQESESVAEKALAGDQLRIVGTATHYHANYVVPKWAFTLEKIAVIGTHIFYRFPGSGGRTAAFTSRWARHEAIPAINWDRILRAKADGVMPDEIQAVQFVPGLTVTPDPQDRHAAHDVGGRLDTTKEWRLSIPDPVTSKQRYQDTVSGQSSGGGVTAGSSPRENAEVSL